MKNNVKNLKKDKMNFNPKSLLVANLFFSSLAIIFAIVLGIMWSYYPLPERFTIEEMSPAMIEAGQGAFLIIIYITLSILILSFILCLVSAIVLSFKLFLIKNFFVIFNNNHKKEMPFYIFVFFYILLAIVLDYVMIYFLLKYEKMFTIKEEKIDQNNFIKYKKKIKQITISSTCLISLFPLAILFSLAINKQIKILKVPNRFSDVQEMYTLSGQKPNTMILYFDRGFGLLFNLCFVLDYLMFKQDSFIVKYPEFTSYVNILSNATNTIASNPTINGGWNYLPYLKNSNLINPILNKPNNEITLNEWFLQSYLNITHLLEYYNYDNIGIYNAPYYGEKKSYFKHANTNQFKNDLQKKLKSTTKLTITDCAEVVKSLGQKPSLSRNDDIRVLQNFAAHDNKPKETIDKFGSNNVLKFGEINESLNISISDSKGSTFIFNHFFTTHEKYAYVANDDFITKNNQYGINYENPSIGKPKVVSSDYSNLLISIWYAVQKLKNIMNYLKHLPYNGTNQEIIKNQYDNTNIYIISDHGHSRESLNTDVFNLMANYLIKNNMLTNQQKEFLQLKLPSINEYSYYINPVFAVKPIKYIHNSWNKKIIPGQEFSTFFDNERLLSLADFTAILDANFQKDYADKINQSTSSFIFDSSKSWFNSKTYPRYKPITTEQKTLVEKLVNNNIVLDPLHANLNTLNNRLIYFVGVEWMFYPNSKLFNIYLNGYFNSNSRLKNIIFNPSNYKSFDKGN